MSSLYPNIDTKKAIIALDLLLRESKVAQTALLVQLTRLVFENNFLQSEFSCDIYHQTYGIAMGTPLAVTSANAFMYYRERDIAQLYAQHLTLYKRFIDDIFVIWDGRREILFEFLSAMNPMDERVKLTHIISDSKISFLGLLLFKDSARQTLQFSTFQKPLNKYLYIPFELFHTPPPATKSHSLKANLCGMPEVAPGSRHSLRRGYFYGSGHALGVILLSFYYPFLGRLAIAIGVNGSLSLERYLHRDGWFSKSPLIAVMSELKNLSLKIYHTLVLLLVISLPIR